MRPASPVRFAITLAVGLGVFAVPLYGLGAALAGGQRHRARAKGAHRRLRGTPAPPGQWLLG